MAGGIGILDGWMSNMMLRLKVIVYSCDLLARFGSVRLLFVVRHIRCLSLRFLLRCLLGGVRAAPLIPLRALLVCGVESQRPGSCPLFLKNVISLGIEEINSIKCEIFNVHTCILS